ncbi:SAM-dependent methyltransferase [Candidatus Electronema halotolerans]
MNMKNYYLRTTCRMCAESALRKVMELTPTPPGNNFLTKEEIGQEEPVYPLELYFCEHCHHVQLGHVVDPKVLYQKNYSYVSSTSAYFVRHLRNYADEMVKHFDLEPGMLVADIGSNDGTCLQFFQKAGMKVVGVDPALEIAGRATESGIETVGDFFSCELARRLRDKYGPAGFITSHNACAHIDCLDDVVQGVFHWLDKNGVFVLEVGYLLDVYTNVWFDTVYHEHLDYHSVAPFKQLFARNGMELIAAQRISPQGGSIRIMAQKSGGKYSRDESIDKLIQQEHEAGLDRPETFIEFDRRIRAVREQLLALVNALRFEDKSIAGYGAPTKATTLMSHFKLGSEVLDFIVDDNPLKQGFYTPVTHIPVFSADEIYTRRPDYVLILAWNFAEPIMKIHERYVKEGGRFILPMPVPRIVE